MRSVGWLGTEHGLQGGDGRTMESADLRRLRNASSMLVGLTLGWHECEFCPTDSEIKGNGEYRYYARTGAVYCAPTMVWHYVEKHGYRLPEEFLESLKGIGGLVWDWRAERLTAALLDESAHLDHRCAAVSDLVNWADSRALEALAQVTRDEELVDVAGYEIGLSLGILLAGGPSDDLHRGDLPGEVRRGIEDAFTSRLVGSVDAW
jgi:hypothetical protein